MLYCSYKRYWCLILLTVALFGVLATANAPGRQEASDKQPEALHVLVFSKTAGFRHGSIEAAVKAIQSAAADNNMVIVATEDAKVFDDDHLAAIDVIVFLNTTGDILNDSQQAAMERFIQSGGGWVGIHGAADTEYEWPWYGKMMGAYFAGHPAVQSGRIVVKDKSHPAMKHLPEHWERVDEWYDYRGVPDETVQILATLDESTYEGGGMGASHPIAWCHEYDGGRAMYTGGGHTDESFSEPLFMQHVIAGIQWAANGSTEDVDKLKPTIESEPRSGQPPLSVRFVAHVNGTEDQKHTYAWDFDSDGEIDSRGEKTYWTFHNKGTFLVRLFVTSESGTIGGTDSWIVVGNTIPKLYFVTPVNGGVVEPNQWIQYDVLVEDPEEQSPDIERVLIELYQSGDPDGQAVLSRTGSSGRIKIPELEHPQAGMSQRMFLLAKYADQGFGEQQPVIGHTMAVLRGRDVFPNSMETSEGLEQQDIEDGVGKIAFVAKDDMWVSLDPLNLEGIEDIVFSVKPDIKSYLEIRRDHPKGPLVSIVQVPESNGTEEWVEVLAHIGDPGGTYAYFFVFGGPPDRSLFLLRSLHLRGSGISSPSPES